MKRTVVFAALLASVTIALYSPVLEHRFVLWDDHEYVTANPNIRDGLGWSTIKWAFTSTYAANWHPLTWLSHALDYELFGLNPAGHHLDSVIIHALNAVLLFLLLARMSKRTGPSLLVAALFALHPLNVESVAWVAERKNVLSTLFFLLAIAAYVHYVQKPDWQRYALVAAMFACGLMAKPMVITLPFILLLLDYWPLGRMAGSPAAAQSTGSKLVLEKVPLLALSAASAWVTLEAQHSAVRTFDEFGFAIRAENAVVSYGLYLWKMVWPARLAAFYPHPTSSLPIWQVVLPSLTLVTITTLVVMFRHIHYLPVGWFWFLGTLVPVIGLVQVGEQAMADRYAYISLIGIFIMIAWSLADWMAARKVRTIWQVIPALCILAALSFVSSRQISYWDSEYGLWARTVAVTDRNPIAQTFLASALRNPSVAMTTDELPTLSAEQKLDEARWHYEEAIESYRQLVQRNPNRYLPDLASNLSDLAGVERRQNRLDDAGQHYEEALQYYRQLEQQKPGVYLPFLATILDSLGYINGTQNRTDEAHRYFDDAVKIYRQLAQQSPHRYSPDLADALDNLALADRLQHHFQESRAHYREALGLLLRLSQNDSKYAAEVAEVEASLRELDSEDVQSHQWFRRE